MPYLLQYKSAAVIMFAPNGLLHRLQYFTSTSIYNRDFDDEEYKIAIIPIIRKGGVLIFPKCVFLALKNEGDSSTWIRMSFSLCKFHFRIDIFII